ncbi:MAG: DUF559 domain-containing protein [Phycisphaerales bacterium]|nr:DUF559 domain-containing protein [Phycisphaerales bacterium]
MISHREYKELTKATPLARERAMALRESLSDPEKLLWSALKGNRIDGIAFRIQHPLGQYIADFYCHRARFVIEIDGNTHQGDRLRDDARRDAWMQSCGIELMRIPAREVFQNLNGVVQTIVDRARKRIDFIHSQT